MSRTLAKIANACKIKNCLRLENSCFTHLMPGSGGIFQYELGMTALLVAQIHHFRDQLCLHRQGSDNSVHPVCLA
jgi:hypothetical protein